ncbi:Crp/Fnr family transcriptional regulator [Candidatus Parcubacteria bacterium]|nr:MAG: Crp/Fnr family transcriptional regulator [Candidatus Parcubacteria bacterium]
MLSEYPHLPRFKLFQDMPEKDVQEIIEFCRDVTFAKNQFIYLMGAQANAIFLLKIGRVKISMLNEGGKEKIIDIMHPGDSFGEFSVEHGHCHVTEAIALDNVIVCKLDRNVVINLLRQKPQFALNFIKHLNERLIEALSEIEELCYESASKRLARILLKLAQKYGKPNGEHIKFIVKISHEQLAEMAGANRPYISSLISEFKKDGVISYDARHLIINRTRLQDYL